MFGRRVISTIATLVIASLILTARSGSVSGTTGELSDRQASAVGREAVTAGGSLPNLQGEDAVEHLKKQGLYSSLAEAMTAARYKVYADERGEVDFYADNPAQRMSMKFDDGAMRLTIKQPLASSDDKRSKDAKAKALRDGKPRYRRGEASLRLVGAGYGNRLLPTSANPEMRAEGNRFTYHHQLKSNPSPITHHPSPIEEWYINSASGIEHGFTLNSPPMEREGDSPLRVEMEFGGRLTVRAKESGKGVVLIDGRGVAINYDKLKVTDAKGRELAAVMKAQGRRVSIEVADLGAEYPVTIDPVIDTEVRKIQASDRQAFDAFGISVSISGDTVIVGALDEGTSGSRAGAAYIFERNQGGANNWGEVRKILASDRQDRDHFGGSVSISGDMAIVGATGEDTGGSAAGAAYLFERNAGGANNWGQVRKIQASDRQAFDAFGISVSISGDTAIVGANGESTGGLNAGAAYVFERNQGGANLWGQVTKILASDREIGDHFGWSVSISGDTAIVGSPFEDTGDSNTGAAYIFTSVCDQWAEITKSQASDRDEFDEFGLSVSISGDTAIVGAPFEDTGGLQTGAAYIFERNQGGANNWGEVRKILASDRQANDEFGESVSISGNTAIVGAKDEDTGGGSAGAAYLFARNQGGADNWGQVRKIQASDREGDDQFGFSVSISGDTAIVGAPFEDTGAEDAGAAYLFTINCPPMISTLPVSVQRATTNSGATIATVSDDLTPASSLIVSVDSAPAGITLSNLVNKDGSITADVSANCSAPLGPNSVTLSLMDQHGLISMANLTVNVTAETTPPVITCPANITVTATTPGSTSVVVNYPAPTATDNCAVQSVVCTPPSGSAFPLGSTTVTCTATDSAGNSASCSFTVATFDVCTQDDSSSSRVLLWNSATGDYLFCCGSTVVSGRGTPSRQGNIFKLTHYATDRRLTAQVDNGTHRGSASLQKPVGQTLCSITDRDTRNNSCSCLAASQ
ncbi:MAG: HYR domain-containing protein [Acidobacteriota bacterium]